MYGTYDRSRRPVELHASVRVSGGKPGEEEVRRGGGGGVRTFPRKFKFLFT